MRPLQGSCTISPNGEKNSETGMGSEPVDSPVDICVKVSHLHTHSQFEVSIPFDSTFGALKSAIAQKIGSKPELHKLLFRGKEKEDDDNLQTAGLKDNSKVIIVDLVTRKETTLERLNEPSAISIGDAAVAEVREEVDKLSKKVSKLKASIDSGTNVNDKDIVYLTEMLTRLLLKLDGIEAKGEGKMKRKLEVDRVQRMLETLDYLKSTNSKYFCDMTDAESLSTRWETFEPNSESANVPCSPSAADPSPPHLLPSSTSAPLPSPYTNHNPIPYSYPCHVSYTADYSNPFTVHQPDPYSSPSNGIPSTPYSPYPVPYSVPCTYPVPLSSAPYPMLHSFPTPAPHYPYPYYTQQYPYPYPIPQSAPSPSPLYPPPPCTESHSESSQVPSTSPKITQTWERFE